MNTFGMILISLCLAFMIVVFGGSIFSAIERSYENGGSKKAYWIKSILLILVVAISLWSIQFKSYEDSYKQALRDYGIMNEYGEIINE